MSEVGKVKINGDTYHVHQATAVNQKKLMTLVGALVALNSAAGGVEKIDASMLCGTLLRIGEEKVDEIADIVLWKTAKAGGTELVTVDNFQGAIHGYFMLLAKAVEVNLADFFIYLDSVNAEARAASKPSQ